MKTINITSFIKNDKIGYRAFWQHENKNKNAIIAQEGLKVAERKIIMAARDLHLGINNSILTRDLAARTGTYHISGIDSVNEGIKMMASTYRRQPECCLLKGEGAFPTSPSNTGAAARYTHILGTPLLKMIIKDIDFCDWGVDDTGIYQVMQIVPPLPMAYIKGFKGIGVGRSSFIPERDHDESYAWTRQIIDIAYPDGTGYAKAFLAADKPDFTDEKSVREWDPEFTNPAPLGIDKIKKIEPPQPICYANNAVVEYKVVNGKKQVTYKCRIETEGSGRDTKYYITGVPYEGNERYIANAILNKYPNLVNKNMVEDFSGDNCPIKLSIPKNIATDESDWFALKMKKGFTEAYGYWDTDTNSPHFINDLYPIALIWYKERERVVTKRLYFDMMKLERKINNNNLIKKYFEAREAGKIKTPEDAEKIFGQKDAYYLTGLPERTYIESNVKKLQSENKALEKEIKDIRKDIENIKDFIFNEWRQIADTNKKFIEED